ncbi:hypothetical protein ABZ484_17660 [Streptomyces sp. NPDC006393]
MSRREARPDAIDRDRLVAEHGHLVDCEVARYAPGTSTGPICGRRASTAR